MADNQLSFKISTGLKNIIGRDLITDDYVAVFELVKNSFDAYATNVKIEFSDDKITITDNGKGMTLPDINDKWLFVAYSAKKEGVEDEELQNEEFNSFRDKIQAKKYYAGAKGIGRFSCDRLGSKLILTTKKASENSLIEQIEVNWNDFDENIEQEFLEIKVKHRTLAPVTKALKKIEKGTILEISNLNSIWSREKKQGLKHSLEKLINPFSDEIESPFKIFIEDESEKEGDKKEVNKRNKINGEIKNFIFETLNLKTTQILTEIDEIGDYITITLWDRGTLVYKIRHPNKSIPKLKAIKFHLFYLNQAAKKNFTSLMGIQPVHFGSVFLYKNGFRIAPYGDIGNDYFEINTRQAQKFFERLGIRDLIGRIEIYGDEERNFTETSSRDGGLVKNDHYYSMMRCFDKYCLSKLENYLTKVSWKTKNDKLNDDLSALNSIKAKSQLLQLIADEADDNNVLLQDLDKTYVSLKANELINEATEDEIKNLNLIALKFGDKEFNKDAKFTEKEFSRVQTEKEEAEKKLLEEEELRRKLEEELEAERKESLFHKKLAGTNIKEIVSLQHHIDRAAEKINRSVDDLIFGINSGIAKNSLLKSVEKISLESKKISSLVQFVTNANFNVKATTIKKDLSRFIKEYIENVHQEYEHLKLNRQLLNVEILTDNLNFICSFRPIEITMIIDNLFSNSYKAKAKKVNVTLSVLDGDIFELLFSDDGIGIPENALPRVFNLGFTTTEGSGIGLFHVKQMVEKMKGDIDIYNNPTKGAQVKITIKNNES